MHADNNNRRPEVPIAVLVGIHVFGDVGSCVLVRLATFGRGVVPQKYQ